MSQKELTEACESSLMYPSPPAPGEKPDIKLVKLYYGYPSARVAGVSISGTKAMVTLKSSKVGGVRKVNLRYVNGRWLVDDVEGGDFFGP